MSGRNQSKRKKEYTIRVYKDSKDKAIVLSQRYGLPMKVIISVLIDLCFDYDILKHGWEERLLNATRANARQKG